MTIGGLSDPDLKEFLKTTQITEGKKALLGSVVESFGDSKAELLSSLNSQHLVRHSSLLAWINESFVPSRI